MDYRHILAAIDFDEGSERVVARALDLSRRYSAKLTLAHVVEHLPVEPGSELLYAPTFEAESELQETAERQLKDVANRHGLGEGAQVVLLGQVKHELHHYSREHEVDLVVVGSHGRHGLALLLGSTATALLHGAGCDLLAVRLEEDQ